MAKASVTIPQGTRDFGPDVVRKRNYIFNTIRNVFELYGFQPLETPAMENIETLMGKYGEEGDKLIYKIRSNKNLFITYPEKAEEIKKILKEVSDFDYTFLPHKSNKALRYDLTIPFARYVAINNKNLVFPFKRYQIQPVWRGDKPQRGRYREFYQCDADIVGSTSLLNEIELAYIYATVFEQLKVSTELKINSRKILQSLANCVRLYGLSPTGYYHPVSNKPFNETEEMLNVASAIDKFEKIGIEKVKKELAQKNLNEFQIKIIENYLSINGNNTQKLQEVKKIFLESILSEDDKRKCIEGIKDIEFVIATIQDNNYKMPIVVDFTLARGLNYYTGIIFEAKAKDVNIGSIGGGGRYDDLTGLFGVPNIPGVGISFGVDRIYDVMEELNLFPADVYVGTQVLFFHLGEKESQVAFNLMQQLRHKNIRCELYYENAKFDKQFRYAEKKNIPFAIIIGEDEIKKKSCTVKNLASGQQKQITWDELIDYTFN